MPIKEKYYALKARGLCTNCGGSPHAPGIVRCERCAQELERYLKKQYRVYKPLCVQCGVRRVRRFPDLTVCSVCRRKESYGQTS